MVYPNFVQLSATTDQEYENYLHYINLQLYIFKPPNQKGIKKLDMIYTIYFIPVWWYSSAYHFYMLNN